MVAADAIEDGIRRARNDELAEISTGHWVTEARLKLKSSDQRHNAQRQAFSRSGIFENDVSANLRHAG